jgi:predicted transposase YbfD/YdcC
MNLPTVFDDPTNPFATLKDPRQANARHPFFAILFIALCATIAGADTFEAIERWGKEQQEWIAKFIKLPHGIPSPDTFLRVFSVIEPEEFNRGFVIWIHNITNNKVKIVPCKEQKVISLDEKTTKASVNHAQKLGALHTVSAWSTEHRLILGQESVEDKENEIVAIPRLLEMLDIRGAVVTSDAMGCQKKIAQKILGGGADFLLALKKNHCILYDRVCDLFESERARDFTTSFGDKIVHSSHSSVEKNHGRIEYRRCWVIPDAQYLDVADSNGLTFGFNSVVCMENEFHYPNAVLEKDKVKIDTKYFITSLDNDAECISDYKRDHWSIENSLHWVLDVVFDEDRCSVREKNARENFGILRRVALNFLNSNKTIKGGVLAKRQKAAWSTKNLEAILTL